MHDFPGSWVVTKGAIVIGREPDSAFLVFQYIGDKMLPDLCLLDEMFVFLVKQECVTGCSNPNVSGSVSVQGKYIIVVQGIGRVRFLVMRGPFGAQIDGVDTCVEQSDPQLIVVQNNVMDIVAVGSGSVRAKIEFFKLPGFRIEFMEAFIFCPNPDISIVVLAYSTDTFTANGILSWYGIKLFKIAILFWDIVYSPEIRNYPDATFLVLVHRIDGVVGKREWIVFVLPEMADVSCCCVYEVKSCFRPNPDVFVETGDFPDIKVRVFFFLWEERLYFPGNLIDDADLSIERSGNQIVVLVAGQP
jgi:hypothetical protein